MPINTPDFWYKKKDSVSSSIKEISLFPLSVAYQIGHRFNLLTSKTKAVDNPVICIGNITAGGSGKTPTSIAINDLIVKNNIAKSPYFLTRGYGGNERNAKCITDQDSSIEVGDEALLLVRHSNTIVSRDRYKGALLAHDLGADLIIMDDGLQNKTLNKDISFLVIDGSLALGNGKTIPSGPLRESLNFALKRIDAVIIIGDDTHHIEENLPCNIPVFSGNITVIKESIPDKSKKYIAFCGLANPDKFYTTLKENGYEVLEYISYPDHHVFTKTEIERINKAAEKHKADIITTEKDAVRLPKTFRNDVNILSIKLKLTNEDKLINFIKDKLKREII